MRLDRDFLKRKIVERFVAIKKMFKHGEYANLAKQISKIKITTIKLQTILSIESNQEFTTKIRSLT